MDESVATKYCIFFTSQFTMGGMNKPQTLLARAKSVTKKVRASKPKQDETAGLAVAWAMGEITYTQAQAVLARAKGSSVYAVLACGLRHALRLGMLQRVTPREEKA
jgi:hypothetical protein